MIGQKLKCDTLQSWFENLTDYVIPKEVVQIISLGPGFAFKSSKKNILHHVALQFFRIWYLEPLDKKNFKTI